ncbi:hypothetical protein FB451DRAFT_630119 [Mycena latifolia]|nr:hypothetical protein FB451DRAFT_630119 [Mycena latifolia]
MTTWTAAKRVLKDHKNFQSSFAKFNLTPPELVFSLNDGLVPWRATNSVAEEAGKVTTEITKLTRRFDKVERDIGVRLDATHAIVTDVQKSAGMLAQQVSGIATAQLTMNASIIATQRELQLTRLRAPLDAAESSLRLMTMLGASEKEKNAAWENIEKIKADKANIDAQISDLQGTTLTIAPPPPPPPRTPPGLPTTPTNPPRARSMTPKGTSPITPDNRYHSPSQTPPHEGVDSTSANKRRRLSKEKDDDITESQPSGIDEADAVANQLVVEDTDMQDAPPVVRRYHSSHPTRLMAARIDTQVDVKMRKMVHRYTRGPDGTRGFHARRKLNVDERCRTSRRPLSCSPRTRPNVTPNMATLFFLGIIVALASLVQVANATAPRSAFSMFSLNANGLVHPNKMMHINNAINGRRPHAFILNESKTNTKTAKNLPNNDYEILEEGVKTTNHHLYKWGVVLGIRKDIQLVQRLINLDPALKGRVIAADVALRSTNGNAYIHRIFAVYAPWDPGTNDTNNFWPALTALVKSTTTSWSLGGDTNATVTAAERASGGSDARDKFNAFLDAVDGHDLWSARPDRNRYYDWTSSGQDADKNGGSIIDRFVTSKATLVDSEIYVTNGGSDFVPNTNHRAVIASVIHTPPGGGSIVSVENPARNLP